MCNHLYLVNAKQKNQQIKLVSRYSQPIVSYICVYKYKHTHTDNGFWWHDDGLLTIDQPIKINDKAVKIARQYKYTQLYTNNKMNAILTTRTEMSGSNIAYVMNRNSCKFLSLSLCASCARFVCLRFVFVSPLALLCVHLWYWNKKRNPETLHAQIGHKSRRPLSINNTQIF